MEKARSVDNCNDQSNLTMCPECGYAGTLEDFDTAGSCIGCVFCPRCTTEFDPASGLAHEPCKVCEELLGFGTVVVDGGRNNVAMSDDQAYGHELILDIHDVGIDVTRNTIEEFARELCRLINMIPEDLHFWDYEDEPEEYAKAPDHLKGISAIQFLRTSNITIHSLDVLNAVYLNIFSCSSFNSDDVIPFVEQFFQGQVVHSDVIKRK